MYLLISKLLRRQLGSEQSSFLRGLTVPAIFLAAWILDINYSNATLTNTPYLYFTTRYRLKRAMASNLLMLRVWVHTS